MKIRVLSEADCRAVLDVGAAIDTQTEFTLLSQGRSIQGLRSFADSENPPGIAIFNPCFLATERDTASRSLPIFMTTSAAALRA